MRIVLPASRHDAHLLQNWIEAHVHFRGIGQNHQLFLVVPPSVQGEAQDAKAALTDHFEAITVHVMEQEPYGGHPKGPNMHFWSCASLMHKLNPGLPWQLVEPDCLPIRGNAYDVVGSKYSSCGVPFFGNIDKVPWREDEPFLMDSFGRPTQTPNPHYGKIVKSQFGDADTMMSGCAVYPGNLIVRPNFSGLMADFMKGEQSIEKAWDIHLSAAMHADGMAHTDLIASKWNTENYRMEDGRLTCDARTTHEIFQAHPTWEVRKCGGPVHPEAVLVHGCKDDSLFNLIVSGQIPDHYSVRPIAPSTPQTSLPQPPANPQVEDRLARMEKLVEKMMEMQIASKTSAPAVVITPQTPPASNTESVLLEAVLGALPSVGSKKMLSDLSGKLGMTKESLKTAIQGSDKLTIKGPAQWVERIAA